MQKSRVFCQSGGW